MLRHVLERDTPELSFLVYVVAGTVDAFDGEVVPSELLSCEEDCQSVSVSSSPLPSISMSIPMRLRIERKGHTAVVS